MRKIVKMSLAASMLMGVSSVSVQAADILTNVKADGQIRARYERANVNHNGTKTANAYTNRLAVGVGADIAGQDWISAYVQMTNVSSINRKYGAEDNKYDMVNDARQTRLTQSYIDLKYNKTLLRVGRQAINLDNLRFIGTVDWRQMPQTFDAIALVDNTIDGLNLTAAYITQVNTINDGEVAARPDKYDGRVLALNASYQVIPELNVTIYDYMIGAGTTKTDTDLKNNPKDGIGHDTYGIALHGSTKLSEDTSIRYRGEYARQKDPSLKLHSSASKARDVKANYYNIELGVDVMGFLACGQYEVLGKGKNGGAGFSTPLATLHAHNGWADVFAMPVMFSEGLEDLNFSLGYKSKEFGLFKVTYHDYTTDKGGYDIGHEVDAVYTRAIPGVDNLSGMLKYANFKKDGEAARKGVVGLGAANNSVQKVWAMLDYKFATK
ncbi:MAG: OprD family outer membrane porin [Sulfurimonadaceae bacterium]|jgi:hypothetical protein|nr:OprD family outer membrane porin [Sulfurimonadaceae bacterium]